MGLIYLFCANDLTKAIPLFLVPSGFVKVGLLQEIMPYDLKGASQSPSPHFLYPVSYTTDAILSYT